MEMPSPMKVQPLTHIFRWLVETADEGGGPAVVVTELVLVTFRESRPVPHHILGAAALVEVRLDFTVEKKGVRS